MSTYDLGQRLRLTGTFKDGANQLVDPTTVTLQILKPGGSVHEDHSGDLIKDGTGLYHFDLTLDIEGDWVYRWVGTGVANTPIGASGDRVMTVRHTPIV